MALVVRAWFVRRLPLLQLAAASLRQPHHVLALRLAFAATGPAMLPAPSSSGPPSRPNNPCAFARLGRGQPEQDARAPTRITRAASRPARPPIAARGPRSLAPRRPAAPRTAARAPP
eukprot:scaffold2272_cov297-Prasinococcus_capsulatus_cf.AAC.2